MAGSSGDGLGAKILVGIVVAVVSAGVIYYLGWNDVKSKPVSSGSGASPLPLVGGIPVFSDDLHARISRPDKRSLRLPKLQDAEWVLVSAGQATYVSADKTKAGFSIKDDGQFVVVSSETNISTDATVYFVPRDGRKPSKTRPVPDD